MSQSDDYENETQRWFVVTAIGKRGGKYGEVRMKATDEDDALSQFEDYSGFEVRLRHENGGTNYETVFATSEPDAREEAFERKLEYLETLDVEPLGLECTIEAVLEDELYA